MRRLLVVLVFLVTFSEVSLHGADLVGTKASLQKQNFEADREGLIRIKNDSTLDEMKRIGTLVKIPEWVKIDSRLDEKWHWSLPRTANFIEDLGIDFIDHFGRLFQINSAVRTIPRQIELFKIISNPNAAPIEGDRASPHLTGATIDIAKIGMSKDELEWMRKRLLEQEDLDLIEATEEQMVLCFHIMVYQAYVEKSQARSSK